MAGRTPGQVKHDNIKANAVEFLSRYLPRPKGAITPQEIRQGGPRPGRSTTPTQVGADYTVAGITYDGTTHLPKARASGSADIRGSVTPGSIDPAPTNAGEGRAMDAAEAHRPGAGYPSGVVRPQDYPTNPGKYNDGSSPSSPSATAPTSEPTSGPPAPTERTNANGITQKGISLSDANGLLGRLGIGNLRDITTAFQSEALPTTPAGDQQLNKPESTVPSPAELAVKPGEE